MSTMQCRVQYLDDTDPFVSTNFPEPSRPPTFTFLTNVPLVNQIAGIRRILRAPHKLEDCTLQLYRYSGHQHEYSSYLDVENRLDEQTEDFEGFTDEKKNSIILRTQLSVRVHSCIEKLLNSTGRELRRALFSLKQIFQDDKDLVHEFVNHDGLDCLIKIGSEADQNYQNYILRALGQVMLYVDGMNGVIDHNETIQWYYTLLSSKFRLVVKTALKLLLVFVEYTEGNTILLINAITTVDNQMERYLWSLMMHILQEGSDTELMIYTMKLINKALKAIPDQDTFYDLSDCLEGQGMEKLIKSAENRSSTDKGLLEEYHQYENMLKLEDGDNITHSPKTDISHVRKSPRIKSEDSRKSRRFSTGCLKKQNSPSSNVVHNNNVSNRIRNARNLSPTREDENIYDRSDMETNIGGIRAQSQAQMKSAPKNALNNKMSSRFSQPATIGQWKRPEYEDDTPALKSPTLSKSGEDKSALAHSVSDPSPATCDHSSVTSDPSPVIPEPASTAAAVVTTRVRRPRRQRSFMDERESIARAVAEAASQLKSPLSPSSLVSSSSSSPLVSSSDKQSQLRSTTTATTTTTVDRTPVIWSSSMRLARNEAGEDRSGRTSPQLASQQQHQQQRQERLLTPQASVQLQSRVGSDYLKKLRDIYRPQCGATSDGGVGGGGTNNNKPASRAQQSIATPPYHCHTVSEPASSSTTSSDTSTTTPTSADHQHPSAPRILGSSRIAHSHSLSSASTNSTSSCSSSMSSSSSAMSSCSSGSTTTSATSPTTAYNDYNDTITSSTSLDSGVATATEDEVDDQKPRRRRITRQTEQVAGDNSNSLAPSESGYTSSQVEAPSETTAKPGSGVPVSSNAVSSNRRWMMYKMTKASQERADQANQDATKVNEKVDTSKIGRRGQVAAQTRYHEEPIVSPTTPSGHKDDTNIKSGAISRAMDGLTVKGATEKGFVDRDASVADVVATQQDAGDIRWAELERESTRPLRIGGLDFTDLKEFDDVNLLESQTANSTIIPPPPPPSLFGAAPTAPGLPPPPPPSLAGSNNNISNSKSRKTVKLHWNEARIDYQTITGRKADTIWTRLDREVGVVELDTQHLASLFENRTSEIKPKELATKNDTGRKQITVLDAKRSNAINIGMTVLPPPRTIKAAILKMDNTIINREGIEKLLTTMLPTEAEKTKIIEAQMETPDLPLGTAEQFLLTLSSINELKARLSLWVFKLDYDQIESEIGEPMLDLKTGIEILQYNRTFKYILTVLLNIGNFLNGGACKGFSLDYLVRVPEVKDSSIHKHSLLYHLCTNVIDRFPNSTDLYSEIGEIARCGKVDFDILTEKLTKLEVDCKLCYSYLRSVAKHDNNTTRLNKLSDFLSDCGERIIVLKIIHKRVLNRFNKFLLFLGYTCQTAKDIKIATFCRLVSEFALEYRTTRERVLAQRMKKASQRERRKTRGKMIIETDKFAKPSKTDHTDLSSVLHNGYNTDQEKSSSMNLPGSKTRKRYSDNHSTTSSAPLVRGHKGKLTDNESQYDTADDEVLDMILKNAMTSNTSSNATRERRRARNGNRKSWRSHDRELHVN